MEIIPMGTGALVLLNGAEYDYFAHQWGEPLKSKWLSQRFTDMVPRKEYTEHVFVELGLPENCQVFSACDERNQDDFYAWCAKLKSLSN